MSKLSDSSTEVERELTGFCNFSAAGLAINAAAATSFKTTSAYSYLVDGVFKNKAALAAQAFSTGHSVQPVNTTAYYVVALDTLGGVTTTQGFVTVPDVGNGMVPVGIIKVVTNGATTFTANTTALDAVGLTVTYFDVSVLPSSNP